MSFIDREWGRGLNETNVLARSQKATVQAPENDNWMHSPDAMVVNFLGESAIRHAINTADEELNYWL
jgi:hypothetical protein